MIEDFIARKKRILMAKRIICLIILRKTIHLLYQKYRQHIKDRNVRNLKAIVYVKVSLLYKKRLDRFGHYGIEDK